MRSNPAFFRMGLMITTFHKSVNTPYCREILAIHDNTGASSGSISFKSDVGIASLSHDLVGILLTSQTISSVETGLKESKLAFAGPCGLKIGYVSKLFQIFLIFSIKKSANSLANCSLSLCLGKGLSAFVPVRLDTRSYNFFESLSHSSTFTVIFPFLISCNIHLYLYHSFFSVYHWASIRYFLHFFSICLISHFCSLRSSENQGFFFLL